MITSPEGQVTRYTVYSTAEGRIRPSATNRVLLTQA